MNPLHRTSFNRRLSCNLIFGLAAISAASAAPIPMTGPGSYTQDFDSLPITGTANPWVDDSTLAGWYAQRESGTVTILAGNGTSNSGGIYSFGTTDTTERAFGSVGSGSPDRQAYGVVFQNTSASAITISSISYTGEQWRNGGNTTAHKLTLSHLRSATAITSLTAGEALPAGWIAVAGGDFTSPIATATAAALDGNLPANQAAIAVTPAISVAAGEYLYLRWHDLDDSGSDHGLGIDNLTITWVANASPAITLTADPVSFTENAGATASTGTVTIPAALATDLVVSLASSDLTEATVPATVTIPVGETKATFSIAAVNDLIKDDPQGVTLTASAADYISGTLGLTVDNDTDAAITVTVAPTSFSEATLPADITATVALAEVTPVDVLVTLTSNDLTEATVPASVTIPAGQSSVPFIVTPMQDSDLDGNRSVRIDATATDYTAGFVFLTVTDDEVAPTPTLSAGAIAFTGYNADGGDDLAFVALVPIPAGEVIFITDNEWNGNVIGVDGAFNTGEGILTWTAPAGGLLEGTVVTLNSLSLASRSASVGTISGAGSFNLGGSDETAYAYQGTAATTPTGFLAVIASRVGGSTENTGLTANHIILLDPTDVDIAAYIGSRSDKATFTGYLESLALSTNWVTEDGSFDQHDNGTPPDVPFDTTAFTLGSAPSGYGAWATLHAGGGLPNEDFDKDGVLNGLEYFMGSPDGYTANPVPTAGKVTWPHSSTANGTTFKVFTSDNLATWTDVTADATDLDGKVEYVLPTTTSSRFVRLEVIVTP